MSSDRVEAILNQVGRHLADARLKRGAFSAAWDVEEPTNYTCVWDRQLV